MGKVDGTQPQRLAWENPAAEHFTFAPDGQHAALSVAGRGMFLVDAATGAILYRLGRGDAIAQFSFHAASRRIVACTLPIPQVIDWDTGELLIELPFANPPASRVAWHPNGQFVAGWCSGDGIALCDVKTGSKYSLFRFAAIRGVCNSAKMVAPRFPTACGTVPHESCGTSTRAKSCSKSRAMHISWPRTSRRREESVLLRSEGAATGALGIYPRRGMPKRCRMALHVLLGICNRRSVKPGQSNSRAQSRAWAGNSWDLETRQRLIVWRAAASASPKVRLGRRSDSRPPSRYLSLATARTRCDERPTGRRCGNGSCAVHFGPPQLINGRVFSSSLSTGPVDRVMAFQERGGWTLMLEENREKKLRLQTNDDARTASVSHDGRHVAIANWELDGATVWDATNGKHLVDLPSGRHGVGLFSPDGRWLATTPHGVRLWRDPRIGNLLGELHANGTTPNGLGINFSPDSRMLAIAQPNGILRHRLRSRDWRRLKRNLSHVDLGVPTQIVFTPDGISDDHHAHGSPCVPGRIWDLAAMRRELAAAGLIGQMAF